MIGFLAPLFAPAIQQGASKIVREVINKVLPGDEPEIVAQREAALSKSEELFSEQNLQQLEINKAEQQSDVWAAKRWRPLLAMSCTLGCVFNIFLKPQLDWICIILELPMVPDLEENMLYSLVWLTIGLAGLGSVEVFRSVFSKRGSKSKV